MVKFQERIVKKRYGFRSYSPAKDSTELSRATRLVEAYVKRPMDFDTKEVLLNDDWIILSGGFIGTWGFMVHRRTDRVSGLGTALAPYESVWAILRGSNYDKPDTLVFKAVHDLEETKKALGWQFKANPTFAQFDQRIQSLPCVFRSVILWYSASGLLKAEENGYCEFEINPTDSPAS